MSAEALLRDPGFQLNLLLWMTREQPSNAYLVRPLFQELGFALTYIENKFPLPEETIRRVKATGIDICVAPEPDVLLQRDRDKKALYIEAKAGSFSAESSSAKQARGHLLASGPAYAEVMRPFEQCLFCGVVPDPDQSPMDKCLTTLCGELSHAGLDPGPHSVHGLKLDGSDVHYMWDARFSSYTGMGDTSAVVLQNVTDDTDPSPLFLILCEQDYPDPRRQDLNRRVLQSQVHAVLLCDLNLASVGTGYACTIDELLLKTSDGVFQFLGRDRQVRMRRLIRENIFKRIVAFWQEKAPGLAKLENDIFTVEYRDSAQREAFLEWLEDYKRTSFSVDSPPPEEDLPLLKLMEETPLRNGSHD